MLAVNPTVGDSDWQVNPWVDALRRSYRHSTLGNADNRGLDSAAMRETYIPTVLDSKLTPLIGSGEVRLVFICGNPGDGKTAYLERLADSFIKAGARSIRRGSDGWLLEHRGRQMAAILDASEAHEGTGPDERLSKAMDWFGANEERTLLVAINDGRLYAFASRFQAEWPFLGAIVKGTPGSRPPWVSLLDLKNRSLVGEAAEFTSGSDHFLERLIVEFVREDRWEICMTCAARERCPLRQNALVLREREVRERLGSLFLINYLRRVRRATIRDARSALAWIITHDTSCQDVHAALSRLGDEDAWRLQRMYFNAVFTVPPEGDDTMSQLAYLDPATVPAPWLDRDFQARKNDRQDPDPQLNEAEEITTPGNDEDWGYASFRRHRFFTEEDREGASTGWLALQPYGHLDAFLAALTSEAARHTALATVLDGLSRAGGVPPSLSPGDLTVAVTKSPGVDLVVMKLFPRDEFTLAPSDARKSLVGTGTDGLEIRHERSGARLRIDLDLHEFLFRLAEGEVAMAEEQKIILEELSGFRQQLVNSDARRAVLWASDLGFLAVEAKAGTIRAAVGGLER